MANQRYSKLVMAPSLKIKTWKDVSRQRIKFIHRRSNHPEKEGAVEVFSKTLEDYLSDCYENNKIDGIEPDLRLTVSGLFNFYCQKWKHSSTNKVLAKILESAMIQQYEKRLWWWLNNLVRDTKHRYTMRKEKKFLSQIGYIKLLKEDHITVEKTPKGTKHQRKVRFNAKAKIEKTCRTSAISRL